MALLRSRPRARHLVLVGSALALLVGAPSDTSASLAVERHHVVAPGVEYSTVVRGEPRVVAHVARLAPDAGAELRPIVAQGTIGSGRQATSTMCREGGGVLCVNGDFALCPTCDEPYGGVVVDGQVQRTFDPAHSQLSMTDQGLEAGRVLWGGRLVATYAWRAEVDSPVEVPGEAPGSVEARRERRELPLGALNRGPLPDGSTLYTGHWGPVTPSPPSHVEAVLTTAGPVAPGTVGADVAGMRAGAGAVPAGGVVVSAGGRAAEELSRFVDEWLQSDADEKRLVIETSTTVPARHSMGGHPVLLRDGQRQDWYRGDAKAIGRHPRTLLGWTDAGEVLLVAVDGRRPGHSAGLTLDEAVDLLVELGATDAINLDGGGSTTFVGPCPEGPCVLNRPSDGRERLVPMALAVVGVGPVRPLPPAASAPLPPPGPPPGPDPASTAHADAAEQPPPAPPAPEEPPPPPPPTTAPPPPSPEPAEPRDDVALSPRPLPRDLPPRDVSPPPQPAGEASRTAPAVLAALAALAAAVGSAVVWRRREPEPGD